MLKDCPDKPTPEILTALRTGSGKDYPSDELCAVRWAAILAALPTSAREAQLLARIDELMIEHCPEEMTPEQISEYARHQVPG